MLFLPLSENLREKNLRRKSKIFFFYPGGETFRDSDCDVSEIFEMHDMLNSRCVVSFHHSGSEIVPFR